MKKTDLKDNRKERSVDLYMTGRLLRTRLDRAGLSVKQVQKVLGLECPQSIYRWLSGQALPSVENLYVLHRILSCSDRDQGPAAADSLCGVFYSPEKMT